MTDETTGGDQPQGTPADLDALVEKMNAKFTEEFGKRFSGLQGLLDRRDAEYRQLLDDLKTADLSPEEREQVQASKLQQEVEQLRRKNEILSMRKSHPDEADLLERFLEAQSLEDQLNLLATFRKAEAPNAPEPVEGEAAADGKPTPVDKNNPARPSIPDLSAAPERMNQDLANQILQGSGNDRGILARLRRQG
jgi:hypothetical protein